MSGICRSRSPTISSSSAPASAGSRPRGSSEQRRPDASILLLDNHDDFGGHAKRNEFTVDGRFLLGYGGSEAMQSPEALYGPEAKGMLRALGIDYHRFERYFDTDLYPSLGLSRAVFFAREAFGEDRLVTGDPMRMVGRRHPRRSHARAVARGVHRGLPGVGGGQGAAARALHIDARSPSRPWPRPRRSSTCRGPATASTCRRSGGSPTRRPIRSRGGRTTSSRSGSTACRRSTPWKPATRASRG